jgi:lysophospholipase L1-like esterase
MASSSVTIYLFAGDSLTEGVFGEGYVERIARALYQGQGGLEGEVVNAGRRGDTAQTLLDRLSASLDQYRPDWVVLAVGVNDVWIPWLTARSFVWWVWAGVQRLRWGLKPSTDLDQFAAVYRALIDTAQQAGARVLVCTTPPLGERLSSPLNRRLARLNGVIKHVAADRKVPVADVWQAYVEELAPLPKPSNYTPGEWLFVSLDRRRLKSSHPDEISRRRRLHLTFDGLHLNSRGADLWANTILTALSQAQGGAVTSPPAQVRQLGLACFRHDPLQVCCSPGWQVRARDVAQFLAGAYQHLAALTGARPAVWLAVVGRVHWGQLAGPLPYPVPVARWEGDGGILFVPDTYPIPFLRDLYLPETVSTWSRWPPTLVEVGEPARIAALADLLAVRELAHLFVSELQVAPRDPLLRDLLATYLAEVVLHSREDEGAAEMAALWDAWGEVLAADNVAEGQLRLQASALYKTHGDGLVESFVGRSSPPDEEVTAALVAGMEEYVL